MSHLCPIICDLYNVVSKQEQNNQTIPTHRRCHRNISVEDQTTSVINNWDSSTHELVYQSLDGNKRDTNATIGTVPSGPTPTYVHAIPTTRLGMDICRWRSLSNLSVALKIFHPRGYLYKPTHWTGRRPSACDHSVRFIECMKQFPLNTGLYESDSLARWSERSVTRRTCCPQQIHLNTHEPIHGWPQREVSET